MNGVLIKNSNPHIRPIIRRTVVDKKDNTIPVRNQLSQKLLDFNPITLNPFSF